jgi:hypothetical protein
VQERQVGSHQGSSSGARGTSGAPAGAGELDRGEFLSLCEDAIADAETTGRPPPLLTVEAPSTTDPPSEGQETRVGPAVAVAGGDERAWGALVFHDGRWLVELDRHVLRLGRSPEWTIRGYLRAYNDGDCDAVLDHLAPALWSGDGTVSAEEFLAQCRDDADGRARSGQVPADLADIEVTGVSDEGATADIGVGGAGGGSRLTKEIEPVELVPDGLEWTLGRAPSEGDDSRGEAPLLGVRLLEVDTLLLDEITVEGETLRADRTFRSAAFDGRLHDGMISHYSGGPDPFIYQIGLFPFADADTAQDAVASIVDEHQDPRTCPGGCPDSSAVVAHGSFVVEVALDTGSEADLDAVVAAQVARLP